MITKLFDQAMRPAARLPPTMQDDLARVMLSFAGEDLSIAPLTPKEEEALALSDAAAARGDFATDDEVRAVWAKHGP